jgi:hypothetical protein
MTTELPAKPVLEDEDSVLAFTHAERKKILKKMTTGEDGSFTLPEDPAEKKAVISVLKDMDAAALGRKRIKVDERVADQTAGAAALIARVLGAASAAHPYRSQTPIAREAPVLGSEVPLPPMVEGEMAVVGGASETYDAFVARTQANGGMPGSST